MKNINYNLESHLHLSLQRAIVVLQFGDGVSILQLHTTQLVEPVLHASCKVCLLPFHVGIVVEIIH